MVSRRAASRAILDDSHDSDSSSSEDMPTTRPANHINLVDSDSGSESDSSEEDSEEESEEDSDENHGLIDMEASESDDDSDPGESAFIRRNAEEEGHQVEHWGPDEWKAHRKRIREERASQLHDFPQFARLPYELRRQIWQFHCPDLDGQPRLLWLQMLCSNSRDIAWYPTEGRYLLEQTQPLRSMMAVHRESRQVGVDMFPDSFNINCTNHSVRFNQARDIVFLERLYHRDPYNSQTSGSGPKNFCDKIQNLAVNCPSGPDWDEASPFAFDLTLILQFPSLVNVYPLYQKMLADHTDTWIQSSHCSWTTMATDTGGDTLDYLGETMNWLICWHKPVNCKAEGECAQLKSRRMLGFLGPQDDFDPHLEPRLDIDSDDEGQDSSVYFFEHARERLESIRKCPMAVFGHVLHTGFGGVRVSERGFGSSGLRLMNPDKDDWNDDDHLGGGTEDEYESEGIDDAPIPDPETEDEDEGSGIEDDTLAMELVSHEHEGEDATGGFSPVQISDSETADEIELADNAPAPTARTRPIVLDDSDDEDENAHREPTPPRRGRKRQRIVSDDEEDEEPEEARPTKRRARQIVDDDSDEEEVEVEDRPKGRGRGPVVISDSEEDAAGSKAKPASVDSDSDSDSEEDEEDEEDSDDDQPARPLSLAERLRQNREANPIPIGSDEDSEEEDSENGRYGGYEEDSDDDGEALEATMADDGSDENDDEDVYYR